MLCELQVTEPIKDIIIMSFNCYNFLLTRIDIIIQSLHMRKLSLRAVPMHMRPQKN